MIETVITIFIALLSFICLLLIIINVKLWLKTRSMGKDLEEIQASNEIILPMNKKTKYELCTRNNNDLQAQLQTMAKIKNNFEKIPISNNCFNNKPSSELHIIKSEDNKHLTTLLSTNNKKKANNNKSIIPKTTSATPSYWKGIGPSQISSVSDEDSSDFSRNSVMETLYQDTFKENLMRSFQSNNKPNNLALTTSTGVTTATVTASATSSKSTSIKKSKSMKDNSHSHSRSNKSSIPSSPTDSQRLDKGDCGRHLIPEKKELKTSYSKIFQSYFKSRNLPKTSTTTTTTTNANSSSTSGVDHQELINTIIMDTITEPVTLNTTESSFLADASSIHTDTTDTSTATLCRELSSFDNKQAHHHHHYDNYSSSTLQKPFLPKCCELSELIPKSTTSSTSIINNQNKLTNVKKKKISSRRKNNEIANK